MLLSLLYWPSFYLVFLFYWYVYTVLYIRSQIIFHLIWIMLYTKPFYDDCIIYCGVWKCRNHLTSKTLVKLIERNSVNCLSEVWAWVLSWVYKPLALPSCSHHEKIILFEVLDKESGLVVVLTNQESDNKTWKTNAWGLTSFTTFHD